MGHLRLVGLAGIALAVALAACGADEGWYVRENERILEALPQVPGATRVRVESSPYYEGDSAWSPVSGYTTNVVYQTPPEMTDEEVINFYVENMSEDWQADVEEIPIVEIGTGERKGTALMLHFTRGTTMVSVNTDNMYAGGPHTFEVAVDHRGAK